MTAEDGDTPCHIGEAQLKEEKMKRKKIKKKRGKREREREKERKRLLLDADVLLQSERENMERRRSF